MATLQGVHPVPVKFTKALLASKPVPEIVNENTCPFTGGLGDVLIPLICGAVPVEPDTVRDTPLDDVPLPFCTVMVKVPETRVAVPVNCVDVLVDSALFVMLQGKQFGPVKLTTAVVGSKPVPLIVNVNACALSGGFGDVVIPLT